MKTTALQRGWPAALLAAFAATGAHALTAEQVYAKVSPSVWRVVTYDADNLPLGQGSAVVVGSEAVVTNCHVLAKAKRVAVKREKVSLEAKLAMWDVKRDLCQLRVAGLKAPAVWIANAGNVTVGHNASAAAFAAPASGNAQAAPGGAAAPGATSERTFQQRTDASR